MFGVKRNTKSTKKNMNKINIYVEMCTHFYIPFNCLQFVVVHTFFYPQNVEFSWGSTDYVYVGILCLFRENFYRCNESELETLWLK